MLSFWAFLPQILSPGNKLYYNTGFPLQIGGYTSDGLEGWLDEVRFTGAVLPTSEFWRITDTYGMLIMVF